MIVLSFPAPPPLSACFRAVKNSKRWDKAKGEWAQNFGHRAKTARYLAWEKQAKADIYGQLYECRPGERSISGDVKATFWIERPDRRRRDLDNNGKALCDILKTAGVLGDDSQIVDLRFAWAEVVGVVAEVETLRAEVAA